MAEVPGANNYGANLVDDGLGSTALVSFRSMYFFHFSNDLDTYSIKSFAKEP